jgi:hypothetical protein
VGRLRLLEKDTLNLIVYSEREARWRTERSEGKGNYLRGWGLRITHIIQSAGESGL